MIHDSVGVCTVACQMISGPDRIYLTPLTLPDASFGITEQVACLAWLRRNHRSFFLRLADPTRHSRRGHGRQVATGTMRRLI